MISLPVLLSGSMLALGVSLQRGLSPEGSLSRGVSLQRGSPFRGLPPEGVTPSRGCLPSGGEGGRHTPSRTDI